MLVQHANQIRRDILKKKKSYSAAFIFPLDQRFPIGEFRYCMEGVNTDDNVVSITLFIKIEIYNYLR